jgi:hypothetical protein
VTPATGPLAVRIAHVGIVAALLCLTLPRIAAAKNIPPLVTNLSAWYDASDASSVTLGTGTLVAQWNDLSSSGNALSDTTGNPPQLVSAGLNGLNAVNFASLGQQLASAANVGVSGDADRTLITVQLNGVINTGANAAAEAFGIDFSGGIAYFP